MSILELLKDTRRFSFKLDGTAVDELSCTKLKETNEGDVYTTEYLFEGGLKVTSILTAYRAHGACEWVNILENTAETDSGIITELFDCDVTLPIAHEDPRRNTAYQPPLAEATKVYAPRGSTWELKEFYCDTDELLGNHRTYHLYPGTTKSYRTSGGRSSEDRAPFFNVSKNGEGYIFAVGWTGQWHAHITRGEDDIRFASGVENVRFRMRPHEVLRTSSIVILPYTDDGIGAQNKWRRLVKEHFSLVGTEGRDAYGPLCASVWGGMHTDAVLERIACIQKEGFPYDYIWMDAGWYGETTLPTPDEFEGDWSKHTGDWTVSPHIHRNGLKDVSDAIHRAGMKFILWFEPERVIKGTPMTIAHPEYFIEREGQKNMLLNLGREDAWQYCFDTLSTLIERIGVDCYRQDFNFAPLSYWQKNDEEDRLGITEIKHIGGLYRLWDALLARFPHLLIDNCASGGRRLDIEMLRRSMPLWRSDYQCPANYDVEASQIHSQTFGAWMPYSGTGGGRAHDEYRIRSAYGASLTTNWFYSQRDAFADTEEKIAFIRKYTTEYLSVRPYFSEDIYPLTSVHTGLDSWCATQYDRPSHGDGIVQVFRREESPYETASFPLHAIDENAVYEITDLDGGSLTVKGLQLKEGFRLSLPLRKAKIYLYKKI